MKFPLSGAQSLISKPIAWSRVAVLVGGGLLLLILLVLALPIGVNHEDAGDEAWIDQVNGFVLLQKSLAQAGNSHSDDPTGNFEPYLGQLALVRHVYRAGNQHGTYVAMNHLMDMLEVREGGIADEAADAIWDYCDQVTPAAYHDVSRHVKARDRASLEWQRKVQDRSPPVW